MRFSPVILIAGAGSAAGVACAQRFAEDASGGLLLVDGDEALLNATADTLQRPPERVSMLAFDIADASRWQDAANFVRAQYGRLDWAIACISPEQKRAVDPGAAIGLIKAVAPLMQQNAMGGAVSLIVSVIDRFGALGEGRGVAATREGRRPQRRWRQRPGQCSHERRD